MLPTTLACQFVILFTAAVFLAKCDADDDDDDYFNDMYVFSGGTDYSDNAEYDDETPRKHTKSLKTRKPKTTTVKTTTIQTTVVITTPAVSSTTRLPRQRFGGQPGPRRRRPDFSQFGVPPRNGNNRFNGGAPPAGMGFPPMGPPPMQPGGMGFPPMGNQPNNAGRPPQPPSSLDEIIKRMMNGQK